MSAFLPRAVRIVDRAKGLGWGYYDYLADRLYYALGGLSTPVPARDFAEQASGTRLCRP